MSAFGGEADDVLPIGARYGKPWSASGATPADPSPPCDLDREFRRERQYGIKQAAPFGVACVGLRADDLLAEMPETVITLEIGAGPADDAVAGGVAIPVAAPAELAAGLGVGIAPASEGRGRDGRCSYSSTRCRLAIGRSPI